MSYLTDQALLINTLSILANHLLQKYFFESRFPQINNANVTLTKSTNKQFATIGETISYTILITNSGNTAANNVQLTDPLPNGTILTPGTVTLNGFYKM